ncbi:MAG: aldo/keto reductase [Bacillota bacterium]|nr:aldo/keto reductase [Bacillota bacterium]
MKFKEFGKIDEPLSAIGLGTWQFSGKNDWNDYDEAMSIRIIHKAIDSGINFIDTAPVYGLGHSETIVGKALKGKRSKVFLASKMGLVWDKDLNVKNNLTKKSIFKEIDESLQRLDTDYLDLYQCHWPDPDTSIEETMDALMELKRLGKIRYIGVSNFSTELLKRANEIADIASFQGLYNMLEQNSDKYHNIELGYKTLDDIIPLLEKNGQIYLPYSPLMQGLLANHEDFTMGVRKNNPQLRGDLLKKHQSRIKKINTLSRYPINEVAINWLRFQKSVGPVIAGVSSVEQLEANLKSLQWEMTPELYNEINE